MALKDKLMTLEDFKAVRDVDVASNSTQFTEIKADLGAQTGLFHWYEKGLIDLSGSSANLTPETNQGINCAVVECSAGDKFIITGTGGNKSRAWGFIDSNNSILTVSDANVTVENFEITAPTNAVRLVLNADKNHDIYAYKVGNNLATKAQGGLSDDIKDALINCFAKVAWSSDTEGRECYNALLSAFHVIDFYNKFEWVYSNGDIVKLNGTLNISNGILNFGNTSPYKDSMRIFCVTKGKATEIQNTSPASYLIPVPKTANNVSVIVAANTIYIRCQAYRYDPTTGKYELVFGTAWAQGSISKAFTAGNNLYLAIILKATSDGTTAFVTEPTEVTAIFTEG